MYHGRLDTYDAIVIGAGHNGLVTAGYLAKAGLKVAVFEKRQVEGGCAVTEEKWPGFKISTCAYVNSLFRPEIVADLELKKFGYEMLPRNPSSFTPLPDRQHLFLGPDQRMWRHPYRCGRRAFDRAGAGNAAWMPHRRSVRRCSSSRPP